MKKLPFSKVDASAITVRPFVLPKDAQLIYQWGYHTFGSQVWQGIRTLEEIMKVFKSIEESDIAQAFIVETEYGMPIFEIDLRLANTDPLSTAFQCAADDHLCAFFFPATGDNVLMQLGLAVCLKFLLLETEGIERMLMPIYKRETFLEKTLAAVGFKKIKVSKTAKILSLYAISKVEFLHLSHC
jgi:hypothetical protein